MASYVEAVHTAVEGRARFRVRGLKHAGALGAFLENRLSAERSLQQFRVNSLTGTVLVLFDPSLTAQGMSGIIGLHVGEYYKELSNNPQPSAPQPKPISAARRAINKLPAAIRPAGSEAQPLTLWHTMNRRAVLKALNVLERKGLSEADVMEALKRYGPNLLPEAVPKSALSMFFGQFNSLPVLLLGIAAGVSVATGGVLDAVVILAVVMINAVIGYVTERKAERIISSLKTLVRPSASVLRDGAMKTISTSDVVPGDIVVLGPGSYVPADARLLKSDYFSVDESALTGESLPVVKDSSARIAIDAPLGDRLNMVYMGTLVTGGRAVAVVTATGAYTEIGIIQTMVSEAESPDTPMERQLDRQGVQLVYISSAVCGVVFLIGILRGYSFLQMLKMSISLAVAAVPEGLPTVATTTLALGITEMRRHKVLIRHLGAVEALGSVQVLCVDKTGTLTLNSMDAVEVRAGMRRYGIGDGKFTSENGETVSPLLCHELEAIMQVCVLCNESELEHTEAGDVMMHGSSTENALLRVAVHAGLDVASLRKDMKRVGTVHRAEGRNFMATMHERRDDEGAYIAIKGSPVEVFELCTHFMRDGDIYPIDSDARFAFDAENEAMANRALRILGVAYRHGSNTVDLSSGNGNGSGKKHSRVHERPETVWLGMVGMADPLRPGVREVIGKFHRAGIRAVMITGDQSPTAAAIGKELDLAQGDQLEILDSSHIEDIPPEVLAALSRRAHVFARVSPSHKLRIVQGFQRDGKVVAMTGDGINDAPALKAADVGVAMGSSGTDVARDVADIILEEDDLETMIVALGYGRTIYGNIRKSINFLLSSNLSEIMVTTASVAGGVGAPLTPMQLLWINLISDIFPGLALALEAPEPDVLDRPPRDPHEPIIRTADYKRIAVESTFLSVGALGSYAWGAIRYGQGMRAGTLSFMTLSIAQLLHTLHCRSERHSAFDFKTLAPNKYLGAALAGSIGMQVLLPFIPGARSLLGITPLGLADWAVVAGCSVAPLIANDAYKILNRPEEANDETGLHIYV